MNLREMEVLVRVAEAGSMTRAAQQVSLTPAAVSATIKRVEGALGVRIFERTTRSLYPTEEGRLVIAVCRDTVSRWQHTLEDVRGHPVEIHGTVHLSAPADSTYSLIDGVLAALCAEHPGLAVILHTGDGIRHLHREAIDIAVRYGPLQDSTLTARRLAAPPLVLVAAPAYLEAHGAPQTPEDLAEHRCVTLQLGGEPVTIWRLWQDEALTEVAVKSQLCGDGYLARRWAVAGEGIAAKSLFDVIDDLEEGRLVRVLPKHTGGRIPIHLVFRSRAYLPARVRTVASAIQDRVAARAERCQGWLRDQDQTHMEKR